MPSSLEEQILDLVVTKLATITVANGYEQTVVGVTRASASPAPQEVETADMPALQVRHLQTRRRLHLRGAYEILMDLEIIPIVAQGDEALADLKGDVIKCVTANELWNNGVSNLAARTWVGDTLSHETEVAEDGSTGAVPVTIKTYEDVTSPSTVKAI